MTENVKSISDNLLKLKVLFPKNINDSDEFRLCAGKPVLPKYGHITPYLIIHYDKKTKIATHHDSLLHPISEEMAIRMFKDRYYKKSRETCHII